MAFRVEGLTFFDLEWEQQRTSQVAKRGKGRADKRGIASQTEVIKNSHDEDAVVLVSELRENIDGGQSIAERAKNTSLSNALA